MHTRRLYAGGLLVSLLLIALPFGPLLGLPIGAAPSTGGSMGDDGVIVNVYLESEPAVGDVVIYEGGPSHDYAAHRVVDSSAEGYVTQGDANAFVDQDVAGVGPVDEAALVGVVVARIPLIHLVGGVGVVVAAAALLEARKRKSGVSG